MNRIKKQAQQLIDEAIVYASWFALISIIVNAIAWIGGR